MKKLLTLLLLLCCLTIVAQEQKTAILVVQFGTSNADGRKASLDVIMSDVNTQFAQYEVREAYSSPTIRNILAKKGLKKDSPTDALLRLHLDGYDKVIVAPTFLLDGVEMSMLREEVKVVSSLFADVKVGNPLLYSVEDFHNVADMLTQQTLGKKEAVLYVGHGNQYASTGAYAMLGQMIRQKGNYHMGTVEGWPDRDASVDMIDKKACKTIHVVPLLLAAGVHAREDIEEEWVPALEKKGFKVEMYLHGLGERTEFRHMFIQKIAELAK